MSGLLALTSAGAGDRTSALRAIADYQKALVDEIERAEEGVHCDMSSHCWSSSSRHLAGHRIIGYLLPALNGARRALNESLFTWTVSDTPPVTASSSSDHLRTVQGALEQSWDLNTEGGRLASATLQQYETTGSPISAGLLVLCDLDAQRAYWTSVLTHAEAGSPGWKSLLATDAAAVRGGSSAHQATGQALSVWSQTIASLQQHDSEGEVDSRAFELLVSSLVSPIGSQARSLTDQLWNADTRHRVQYCCRLTQRSTCCDRRVSARPSIDGQRREGPDRSSGVSTGSNACVRFSSLPMSVS